MNTRNLVVALSMLPAALCLVARADDPGVRPGLRPITPRFDCAQDRVRACCYETIKEEGQNTVANCYEITSFLLDDFIKICYQQGREHLYCCALVWMLDGFRCFTPAGYYPEVPTSLPQYLDRAHRKIAPPQIYPPNDDKGPSEQFFPPKEDLPGRGAPSRDDGSQKTDGSPAEEDSLCRDPDTGKQGERAPASPGRTKANDKSIKVRVVDTTSTGYEPQIADGRGFCSYRSDATVSSFDETGSLQQLAEPFNLASGTGSAEDNLLQPDLVDLPPYMFGGGAQSIYESPNVLDAENNSVQSWNPS